MITYVKKANADKYSSLYERATEDLKTHSADGLEVEKGSAEAVFSYDYEKGEYTSMNGNVIVSSNKVQCAVNCSSNNTILKDTAWFKENRNCPEAWR